MGFCPSGLLSQWAFVRSPFENRVNPDEMAPYEPSHQDFHCLLCLFNFYSNYSKIKELR